MSEFNHIYDFWIGKIENNKKYIGQKMGQWFAKNEEADRYIIENFAPYLDLFDQGSLDINNLAPKSLVAAIILLDQFPRNSFRGHKRSFAYDATALKLSKQAIEDGIDKELHYLERLFLYLPLEHSENIDDQNQCVKLFEDMAKETKGTLFEDFAKSTHEYAIKHQVIIERFGRFPHRNQVLERISTEEELEFIKGPNSSF